MFAAQVIVFLLHSIRVLQSIFDAGNFFTQLGALYPNASEHFSRGEILSIVGALYPSASEHLVRP